MPIPGGTLALLNKKEKDRGRSPSAVSGGQSPRHSPSSPSHRRLNQSPSHSPAAANASSLGSTSLMTSPSVAAATGVGRHQSPRSPRRTPASAAGQAAPPTVMAVAAAAAAADPPDYTSCCCYPGMRLGSSSNGDDGRRRKANRECIPAKSVADHDATAARQCDSTDGNDHHQKHQQSQQTHEQGVADGVAIDGCDNSVKKMTSTSITTVSHEVCAKSDG